MKTLEPSYTFSESTHEYSCSWKQYGSFSRKWTWNYHMTQQSTSGCTPRRTGSSVSQRHLHSHVHGSSVCNNQKAGATRVSVDRWMDKQKCISVQRMYSALKRKVMLTYPHRDKPWEHYAKRNNPKDIYCSILPNVAPGEIKFTETESRVVAARGWWERGMGR